uniref:Variable surface glycoprotein n=1 Tax=Trypanosoma evansi TaxID=5697 RepID=Q968L8_TRYEV|nr:variable surface glycoprotein [Trypanosoma evansi]
MLKNRNFVAIAVVTFAIIQTTEAAQHKAFKWDDLKQICNFAIFLKKLPAAVEHKAAEAKKAIQAADEANIQASMAAYKTADRNASIVYAAAAAAANSCLRTALDNLANLYSTGIMASAKAGQTIGHVEEFIGLLKAASKGGATAGYCLSSQNTDAPTTDTRIMTTSAQSWNLTQDQQRGCSMNTIDNRDQTFSERNVLTGQDTNVLTSKSADGRPMPLTFSKKRPHKLVQGLLAVTAKQNAGHGATITKQDAIATEWAIQRPANQLQKLYVAVADAKKAIETQTYCGADAKSVILHVMANGAATEKLEKYLKAIYPAEKKDAAANDARAMIDKVAGTGDNQHTKIQEQIVSTGATKIQGTTAESKQLKDISGNDQLQTAFLAQRAELIEASSSAPKACQSQNTAHQKKSETDATCEKKEVDKCEKPCKVVEANGAKKCTLDKDEAKKLEEKTDGKTNTTGSNSLLIKASPLLLAVFLF